VKIKEEIIQLLKQALPDSFPQINLKDLPGIEVDLPKNDAHGDFSTNLGMKLARGLKMPPFDIANKLSQSLSKKISNKSSISHIRVERPGYINFFLKDKLYHSFLISLSKSSIKALGQNIGKGKKIQLEFVSANPTGPLSVAHGRQAAVGESLARIFRLFGFKAIKEYYINDEGNQINLLGASILARLKELEGKDQEFPEGGYQGEYIKDIAKEILEEAADRDKAFPEEEASAYGLNYILDLIKKDSENFGVKFDVWYSQKSLMRSGNIERVLRLLKRRKLAYLKEGALWFKSTSIPGRSLRLI